MRSTNFQSAREIARRVMNTIDSEEPISTQSLLYELAYAVNLIACKLENSEIAK